MKIINVSYTNFNEKKDNLIKEIAEKNGGKIGDSGCFFDDGVTYRDMTVEVEHENNIGKLIYELENIDGVECLEIDDEDESDENGYIEESLEELRNEDFPFKNPDGN